MRKKPTIKLPKLDKAAHHDGLAEAHYDAAVSAVGKTVVKR